MQVKRGTAKAELFVWTDVDADYEADFNSGMTGSTWKNGCFIWSRRLRLTAGAGPRYLAVSWDLCAKIYKRRKKGTVDECGAVMIGINSKS